MGRSMNNEVVIHSFSGSFIAPHWFIDSFFHSLFHSLIYLFTDSFPHSLIHSFIYWFAHSLNHWLIQLFVDSLVHLLSGSLICSFIDSSIHWFTQGYSEGIQLASLIDCFTHWLISSFLYWFWDPRIHVMSDMLHIPIQEKHWGLVTKNLIELTEFNVSFHFQLGFSYML